MPPRDGDVGEPINETAEALADLHVMGIVFDMSPAAEGGLALLEDLPGYGQYMVFLARHEGLLKRAGVRSLESTFTDRERLNGDGVFHIYPGDFESPTREGLRAALGISADDDTEDTQRDLPVLGQRADASARRPARVQGQMRSRLLGALRFLDPLIPPRAANSMARKFSSTAALQLEDEIEAAQGQRDKIAVWYVAHAGRLLTGNILSGTNLMVQPTDSLHTKFNIFYYNKVYIGYSLKISPLPPFRLTLMRSKKIGGQWKTTIVLEKSVSDLANFFKAQQR